MMPAPLSIHATSGGSAAGRSLGACPLPRALLHGFVLPVLLLLASCGRQPAEPAQSPAAGDPLTGLYNACVNAMVQQTCRVMQDKGGSLVTPGATTIFVAGIGPVDAELYSKLRESGEGMCGHVRQVCAGGWDSAQCKTARALYGST